MLIGLSNNDWAERLVISAAGISVFGTTAASDFLTGAQEFRKIQSEFWQTDRSGDASIVAAPFW